MKKLTLLITLLLAVGSAHAAESLGIVPKPNQLEVQSGTFCFDSKTRWLVENVGQQKLLSEIIRDFKAATGWQYSIKTAKSVKRNAVIFHTNNNLASEGYKINATTTSIHIEAATNKGFFYALQTLRQLLPAEINAGRLSSNINWNIPCVSINDAPRFGYRGFMLDVSRFFMPKKNVLRLIDFLAYHKINFFHWHLVDDNGWRIEIKKYPRLTDVSAWRVDRTNFFSMRTNPEPGEATTIGGFYTQDDIREIVKYAQDRYIEIIPEIEMPAHTNSSLAAYPNLTCPVVDHFIGVLPGMGGANAATIYCAGNDSVFTFLENVLSEVIGLFPSKYIHIGGDEANKTNWKICPKCQARMKANNIKNEDELQSYFIKRINTYLINKGKHLMGWDELVESEIPENSVIFGWRGMGLDAEKAGAKGFKYIKSPALKYYFIRYQGPQWFEPYTYFGNTTLKDVYEYEPLPATIPDTVARNMMGVESCLWTEFVEKSDEAEYLIFPRLAAFAESAWTRPEKKNWSDFVKRVDRVLLAYNYMNINYARSMFNLDHNVRPKDGKLEIQLGCIRPDVEIRYTTDGSEPKFNSSLYKNAFSLEPPTMVRASTFQNGICVGDILPLSIISGKAVGASVVSKDENAYVLTNGLRGSEKITDGEWLDYYDRDGEFTVELEQPTLCSQIAIGMLNNSGMGIHLPSEISISVSNDNVIYVPIFNKKYSEIERFQNGIFHFIGKYEISEQLVKTLKINIKKPGDCPPTYLRAGQKCRMAFDEVMVN